jgi:2-oxoglutarate dehydrogenase E2 component (dihydrolipoamide succinyltransferase)
MPVELRVPSAGESIAEVEIAEWLKKEGDAITPNDDIVMLDSAKTTLPLASPITGILKQILKQQGEVALIGDVIAILEEGTPAGTQKASTQNGTATEVTSQAAPETPTAEPAAEWAKPAVATPESTPKQTPEAATNSTKATKKSNKNSDAFVMPAAARELAQSGVEQSEVTPSGPGGRMLKEDVQNVKAKREQAESVEGEHKSAQAEVTPVEVTPVEVAPKTEAVTQTAQSTPQAVSTTERAQASEGEQVVPMTMLRRHIAQRLVEAQQNAALLTTFNEVDMSAVMNLRKQFQDDFTKKHGIKLGFMSFFVKASVEALKAFPAVNAEIRGRDLVYKNYYDIGVAIGGGKGLVVPVLRDAEHLSFAAIEKQIMEFAGRAKEGTLKPEDLEGGTFTITNGGIYGSLMSTPIINPPQSGILGMHAIQERPVAENGQVVIRPMMYLALTYDHRIIDGREAVSFLVRLKQCLENPARLLLEV